MPLTDAAAGFAVRDPGRAGDRSRPAAPAAEGADGTGVLLIVPYRGAGHEPGRHADRRRTAPTSRSRWPGETGVASDIGLSVELRGVGEYTLLIAKRDPGQGLVWLAFAC